MLPAPCVTSPVLPTPCYQPLCYQPRVLPTPRVSSPIVIAPAQMGSHVVIAFANDENRGVMEAGDLWRDLEIR